MIQQGLDWIWEKIPWFIKWPMVILVGPTLAIMSFLSWHTNSIHATIRPYEERRDAQISSMSEKHGVELRYINETLQDIKAQNGQIYDHLLRSK
jgi:hypothetical protein